MIVVDASVLVSALCRPGSAGARARAALASASPWLAPEHVRAEAADAIRGMTLRHAIRDVVGRAAIRRLASIDLVTMPTPLLLERAWELRDNLTAYAAAYVATAELHDLPLLTADRRLAAAPGIRCRVVHP